MGRRILLAGATGALGREVLKQLKAEGHWVRILTRSHQRAKTLADLADEVRLGDALVPASLAQVCEGIDTVVSCLGAPVSMRSSERRSYLAVDTPANLNLLTAARKAGVGRFVYVSLWIEPGYSANGYVEAHRRVEAALKESGLSYTIVRPTGLFSAMTEFLTMARGGLGMLPGGGSSRTNPVHEADVARQIAALIDTGPEEVGIGGPEVLSRRQIIELAFEALGKRPRSISPPASLLGMAAGLITPFDGRTGDLMRFFAQVATCDGIAPAVGQQRLIDYYRDLAKK